MADPETELAEFVSTTPHSSMPASVVDHAALVVADTVGAIVGGSTASACRELAETWRDTYPGDASVLGTAASAAPGQAALINGTSGTRLELDEGHKYAVGHPAIHVFPAVLAEAEASGIDDGKRLLTAVIVGYEAATRVARACNPIDERYHMHGIWGTVGAAAGVARFRGYDAATTLTAMRIAANRAQHTRFEAATEGATVRNSYAGTSNLEGLLAADQAEAGITALDRGIERHLELLSSAFDSTELADELGDRWEITRGYFKLHAACRYTHPVLDALDELLDDDPLSPADVASVRVETYPTAARLDSAEPTNALQAKFSIPFAVATRIISGHSEKPAFEEEALTDAAFELAERVSVEVADDIAARVPDARGARVTVTSNGGIERTVEIEVPRGDPEWPITEPELEAKYEWLVEPVVGRERAERLWETARSLPETSPLALSALASP